MALVRTLLRSISNLSICRMTSKFSLNASRANSLFTSVFTINLSLVSIGRELKVSNSAVNFCSSLKNDGKLGLRRKKNETSIQIYSESGNDTAIDYLTYFQR